MTKQLPKFWWVAGLLIVLLPLAPAIKQDASFDGDWYIHLWFARYYGTYFNLHGMMPWEMNTTQFIGSPSALFYSHHLTPLLGILGNIFGLQSGVRILIFAASFLEFALIYTLAKKVTGSAFLGIFLGAIVKWAIYPYTVVFTEAAIPEFLATTLIACSFYSLLLLSTETKKDKKLFYAGLSALCAGLSAGSHPITALYSFTFLGPIAFGFLFFILNEKKRNFYYWLGILSVVLLILSPWIYTNVIFSGLTRISKDATFILASDNADTWWTRFQPFPFDKRSLLLGQHVDTCYLDTQMNMPLLLLAIGTWIFVKRPKYLGFSILCGGTFILASWMSLSKLPYSFLPKQFEVVQFGWRLITYQNLSLISLFLGFLYATPNLFKELSSKKSALLASVISIAAVAAMERATHSMGARNPTPREGYSLNPPVTEDFVRMVEGFPPSTYFTDTAQAITLDQIQQSKSLTFEVGLNDSFGKVKPLEFEAPFDGWYKTNVSSFDWNTFYLNGMKLDKTNIGRNGDYLVVNLKQGRHNLNTALEIPGALKWLRSLAYVTLMGLVFLVAILGANSFRRARVTT